MLARVDTGKFLSSSLKGCVGANVWTSSAFVGACVGSSVGVKLVGTIVVGSDVGCRVVGYTVGPSVGTEVVGARLVGGTVGSPETACAVMGIEVVIIVVGAKLSSSASELGGLPNVKVRTSRMAMPTRIARIS